MSGGQDSCNRGMLTFFLCDDGMQEVDPELAFVFVENALLLLGAATMILSSSTCAVGSSMLSVGMWAGAAFA